MITSTTDGSLPAVTQRAPSSRVPDPDWDGDAVDALRAREYARLDAQDQVYLDYTGGGLYAESQLREHLELLRSGVFGNPHSDSPTSRAATRLADDARRAVLAFFNASPDEYTVVFTANASAALKLVGESFPFEPGQPLPPDGRQPQLRQRHPGVRPCARCRRSTYLPLRTPDLRVDGAVVLDALDRVPAGRRNLFAYPAQSNYSGVRHPLDWVTLAHERGWDVLLDASAFVPDEPPRPVALAPGLRRDVLVQGLRLPDGDRLARRPPRGARPPAPPVVRRRDDRGRLGRRPAPHPRRYGKH